MFSLPVWNTQELSAGIDETDRCRMELLASLKEMLDHYHRTERSIAYYDLVAGDWLISFSHKIYLALREVLCGAHIHPGSDVHAISDVAQALTLACCPEWHRHLQWAVASRLRGETVEHWNLLSAGPVRHQGFSGRLQRLLRCGIREKPKVIFFSPGINIKNFEKAKLLFRWRKWAGLNMDIPLLPSHFETDGAFRKYQSLQWSSSQMDFLGICRSLLPVYLPVSLLEGLNTFRKRLHAADLPRPQAVFSNNLLHGDLAPKLLLGEWKESGTLLLYCQHGGGYGIEHKMILESYEIGVSDLYYSWGWRRDTQKVKPLSPGRSPITRVKKRRAVLLSCLELPSVPYRLTFVPMPGTIEGMNACTIDFLEQLPESIPIIIRPYPVDYGWGMPDRMQKAAPHAIVDRRSRYYDLMDASALTVHNYLGTTWLETIGLGVPTICFYDPQVYLFREEACPIIDQLHAVGILHTSGKSAAQFIIELGDRVSDWWSRPEVQSARDRFMESYFRYTPNWPEQWESSILDALNR